MTVALRFTPGSSLWLLKHELTIFVHGTGLLRKQKSAARTAAAASVLTWIAITLFLHWVAFGMLNGAIGARAVSAKTPMVISLMMAICFSLMLSTALKVSVEALFERGDLNLLLSSPLDTRKIFVMRLLGVAVGVAGIYLFFLTPFAHAGAFSGKPKWVSIYPTVIGMALFAASLGMVMTLSLVRSIGIRRTRFVAQFLSALSGAGIFLFVQSFSGASEEDRTILAKSLAPLFDAHALLGPDSMAWFPGRAMMGSPGPLSIVVAVGILSFWLTSRFSYRQFIRGFQDSEKVSNAKVRPRGLGKLRFRAGATEVVVLKEWRLIARDPQLISQVLLQMLYMLPAFALIFSTSNPSYAGVSAGLIYLSASLASSLAWIIISAEEAPDLLQGAPCGLRQIRDAKFVAVVVPPLALVSVPIVWLTMKDVVVGLLLAALIYCATRAAVLIALRRGTGGTRSEFRTRIRGNFLTVVLEKISAIGWAATAFFGIAAMADVEWAGRVLLCFCTAVSVTIAWNVLKLVKPAESTH